MPNCAAIGPGAAIIIGVDNSELAESCLCIKAFAVRNGVGTIVFVASDYDVVECLNIVNNALGGVLEQVIGNVCVSVGSFVIGKNEIANVFLTRGIGLTASHVVGFASHLANVLVLSEGNGVAVASTLNP